MEDRKASRNLGGRKPKSDPRKYRYVFRLDSNDNETFLKMYVQSRMNNKAKFIVSALFGREIKTVVIDKYSKDFYMQLTAFYTQFRAVGINYNQVVKLMHTKLDGHNASAYLLMLEKLTTDLAEICREIVVLTKAFEQFSSENKSS